MKIQLSQESRKAASGSASQWRERFYVAMMRRMTDRSNVYALPTEDERRFVCTGFILSMFSIVAAFFPICGLPIAITSLVMGLAGRRVPGLYTMATWTVALAIIGLGLTLANIIIGVSIYFSSYVWG
jgi:uncharacterized membrane protein